MEELSERFVALGVVAKLVGARSKGVLLRAHHHDPVLAALVGYNVTDLTRGRLLVADIPCDHEDRHVRVRLLGVKVWRAL